MPTSRLVATGLVPAGLAAALVLAWGSAGCEREGEQEAEQTLAAIGRMRDSQPSERGAQLDQLEALQLEGEAARAARDRCVAAYRALDQGKALAAEAERDRDLAKATAASDALKTAGAEGGRCDEAVAALRRSLGP